MPRNTSTLDAGLRAGIGMFLLASPLLELATYPLNLVGIVLIASGLLSYCPLYSLGRMLVPNAARAASRV